MSGRSRPVTHFPLCLLPPPLLPLWHPPSMSLGLYPWLPSLPLPHFFWFLCVSILFSSISSLSPDFLLLIHSFCPSP